MGWTVQKEEELGNLVNDGKTSSQIAGLLGVTRNAVIGKCQRLGLRLGHGAAPKQADAGARAFLEKRRVARKAKREKNIERPQPIHAERPPEPTPIKLPFAPDMPASIIDEPVTMVFGEVSLLDAKPLQCRWIESREPYAAICCGMRVKRGSSYCSDHHSRVWNPAPERKRSPARAAEWVDA